MYKGFDLEFDIKNSKYIDIGKEVTKKYREVINKELEKYLGINGALNGTLMQKDWFPEIQSHIFLSHSHADEEVALTLAGFLYKQYKIKTFIDSTVWGYSNDLLKSIDDKYSLFDGYGATYDYNKRNASTSHVHMMLSSALSMMIDKAECLLFLNTPNSITTEQSFDQSTYSPWIYSELATSRIIRKIDPRPELRKREIQLSAGDKTMFAINESLEVYYDADTTHLIKIKKSEFIRWAKSCNQTFEIDALEDFYNKFNK